MSTKYPKVLIIGISFDQTTGGGITLTNLFKDWPIENLAVTASGKEFIHCSFDTCNNYYSLGKKEFKALWPLVYLQKQYDSGKLDNKDNINIESQYLPKKSFQKNIRKWLVEYLFSALHFLGLYHFLYRYYLSNEFESWVKQFDPDIIYAILSSLELIRFVNEIHLLTSKPLAIHIMDDWPQTISKPGILQMYWKRKIGNEFKDLLNKANLFFSISDGMSKEYLKRYNKCFEPFHNPIEIDKWLPFSKSDYNIGKDIKILYTGRIGTANSESIYEACLAIDTMNKGNSQNKIELHIYTIDYESRAAKRLTHLKGIKIFKPISHDIMPKLLSSFDILFLPLDFSRKGIRFAKFSMPTKASEYMISGVPILLFCSEELSIYQHAVNNKWAYVLTKNKTDDMCSAINELCSDIALREKLGNTARNFAIENYNADKIRKQFSNSLNI
jgi:glycosyltransferase involved in cell wall biosynthesis